MINISSISFDIRGAISFEESPQDTNFGTKVRRQNRIATLDGGIVLQDRGFSIADVTYRITVRDFTEDLFNRLSEFVETQSQVRLTSREGTVIGSIANLSSANANFQFLVTGNG